MDPIAELQHIIREARHDAWGIWINAKGMANDLLRLKADTDEWRDAAMTALSSMCKASLHFARLDLDETKMIDGVMQIVAGISDASGSRWKARSGSRLIGSKYEQEIIEFAQKAGLWQVEGEWNFERKRV